VLVQVVPQAPQFAGSAKRSIQVALQAVLPTSHVHTPVEQTLPPVHAVPQAPQWVVLDLRSTQTPVQEVRPVPHVAASVPPSVVPAVPPLPAAPSFVVPAAPPIPAVPVESALMSCGVSVGASTPPSVPAALPAAPPIPPACPPPPVPAVSPPTPLVPPPLPPPPLAPPEPVKASTASFPASCVPGLLLLPPQPTTTKSNTLKPTPRCFFMSISREDEGSEDRLHQRDPAGETDCGVTVRMPN